MLSSVQIGMLRRRRLSSLKGDCLIDGVDFVIEFNSCHVLPCTIYRTGSMKIKLSLLNSRSKSKRKMTALTIWRINEKLWWKGTSVVKNWCLHLPNLTIRDLKLELCWKCRIMGTMSLKRKLMQRYQRIWLELKDWKIRWATLSSEMLQFQSLMIKQSQSL